MGTPRKTNLEVFGGKGCFICGRDNSRKRHSLGGRNACKLQELLLGVLPLTKELLIENCSRYICELSCVKDIYKYYKLKANVEALKSSLMQRFEGGVEQRVKRCLPSDVEPQISSAPKAKQIVTSNKHMKSVGHSHKKLMFDKCCADHDDSSREPEKNSSDTQPIYPPCPRIAAAGPSSCDSQKIDSSGFILTSHIYAPKFTEESDQSFTETCNTVEVSKF